MLFLPIGRFFSLPFSGIRSLSVYGSSLEEVTAKNFVVLNDKDDSMGRYQQVALDESLFQVRTWLSSVHTTHMPLLILAGPHGRGKTTVLRTLAEQDGYPCLNLNLALSRALLDVLPSRLPTAIPDVLRELIGTSGEPLLLSMLYEDQRY